MNTTGRIHINKTPLPVFGDEHGFRTRSRMLVVGDCENDGRSYLGYCSGIPR